MRGERDFIAIAICVVAAPLAIWIGWRRFREGKMPNVWLEHDRVLVYINYLNSVLGRPEQKQLTVCQIRVVGILYMILGIIGLILCLAWLSQPSR